MVNFRFNIRGGQRFGEVTSANVGRPFAIVLDGKVISAPRILGPITGGSGQISGHFTVESANNLAILLRAGALPAKLTIVEERTIGPGLGQDSIEAGKRAAFVGAGLVLFYMLITYGTFGIFANIALLVHIAFIFAALILLGATLTLPGIAGIVLTIGMAVDSNVLIYERIREESHAGRSIISSLDAGFKRAFATIVDSNVTMFVAAAILYFLGSGPVRGFAVSLGARHPDDHRHRGDHDAHDDRALVSICAAQQAADLGRTKASIHEASTPRPGEYEIPVHALSARELSVLGGDVDRLRGAVPDAGYEFRHRFRRRHLDGAARQIGPRRHRRRARRDAQADLRRRRGAGLRHPVRLWSCASEFPKKRLPRRRRPSPTIKQALGKDYDFRRVEVVGPRVSGELVQSGTLGVVISILAVLCYLWFRFEWQFAIGAIIATMHDFC